MVINLADNSYINKQTTGINCSKEKTQIQQTTLMHTSRFTKQGG